MINSSDVIQVDVTPEDVEYAKTHPVEGHRHEFTGQLKSLGNLAIMKVLGVPYGEFAQQQPGAQYLEAAYVCETRDGRQVGIDPAVLFVRDGNVMTKNVVVPATQLFKHKKLDDRYTVAVFVTGTKDANGNLKTAEKVAVAGWIQSGKLKRWVKKDDNPMFAVKNVTLAVAPCQVLLPMQHLIEEVSHHDARP